MLPVSPVLFIATLTALVVYQAVSTLNITYLQETLGVSMYEARQVRKQQYAINLISTICIAVAVYALASTMGMLNVPLWVALMVPTGFEMLGRKFHSSEPRASQSFAWSMSAILALLSFGISMM